MAHIGCLVCFISTVNVRSKKRRKEGYEDCSSSMHITNLKQSILRYSISMDKPAIEQQIFTLCDKKSTEVSPEKVNRTLIKQKF
jgi:hypothetical protein